MATTQPIISNISDKSDTFIRPPIKASSEIFASLDPSIPLETNKSNDLTVLGIQLLIRGYRKTSINYNLGMSFPSLNNQKIYFPFKTSITLDDLYKTIGSSSYYESPSKTELITLFTSPELMSEVVSNAKKRILSNYDKDTYKNYIVSNINQSIQKGIVKQNLELLNNILFLNDTKIFLNNKAYLIDDSKELKPQFNDFKSQLEKNTPINSILNCNGILIISPILEQKKVISSVTRLNINVIVRGQRKGNVPDYDPGMSFPNLKGKTIYFPFTIKVSKKDLIYALDLQSNIKPNNNEMMSVFTKPGLLKLAIRNALKSGETTVNTIDEAENKNIIRDNLNLINELLFEPKNNITIYGHVYTIHSSDGITAEINKFKNELLSGKAPLLLKLQCNVILNILDSASPSELEFKRLSCDMRKNLIIQDLEEILGTEIERDIRKDIKYLRRAPKISKWDYYKKKGEYYPQGYFPGLYPQQYPGYLGYPPYYPDISGEITKKVRKPITESIFQRGPLRVSRFTTKPVTTASTLDTFTSPEKISPSKFEERPSTNLQDEILRRKFLEQQGLYQPYAYPYQYQFPFQPPYPMIPPQYLTPTTRKQLQTRKKRQQLSPSSKTRTKFITGMPSPYVYPYQYPGTIANKTRKTLKGGYKFKHNNKTIKKL